MINKALTFRLTAAAGALALLPLTGCGGGSSNGDTIIRTQPADPYIYAYGDNVNPVEVSAFGDNFFVGTQSAPAIPFGDSNPAASDTFYFTFAVSNSAPTSTENGAGEYAVGIAPGSVTDTDDSGAISGYSGSFAAESYVAAIPAGSSDVFFRAQGVQGQLANRTVPDIKEAALSVNGGAAQSFDFTPTYNQTTAAGPFSASPYYVATSFAGVTASGVYPATSSITDSANQSTSTNFEATVLASTDAAVAATVGAGGSITVDGETPSVTYGPDANGVEVVIVPPSDSTTVTVTDSDGGTGTGTDVPLVAGEVFIAPNATQLTAPSARRVKSSLSRGKLHRTYTINPKAVPHRAVVR